MNKEEYIKTNFIELFKFWEIRSAFWGAVLFLTTISIDYFIAREYFIIFLQYKIIAATLLFLTSYLLKRISNYSMLKGVAFLTIFISCLILELVILKTGGHVSIFFAYIIMAAVATIGFMPASITFHLSLAFILFSVYMVPIFIFDEITNLQKFIGLNILIIIFLIMMLYLRYVQNKKLKNQFSLQYDLEQLKNNLQNEVNNQTERLRNLTMHIQSISEQERTRIAREIHDELGQALTSMKMDTFWLKKKMPEDQGVLREKIDSMANLISDTISTVQRISSELRPRLLDDLGLQAAMEWHAKDFQERTGIACDMTVDLKDDHLDQDHSTTIFRTFQESLTNVARHADATEVFVRLKENGDNIVMTVADNGKGIEEKQKKDPESFGLIGMRERVRHLGGSIEIHGVKNQGTTIKAVIPGNNKKNNDSIM
jgi:signal transduction histidine kinase